MGSRRDDEDDNGPLTDEDIALMERMRLARQAAPVSAPTVDTADLNLGVLALRERDPSFDAHQFLEAAAGVYQLARAGWFGERPELIEAHLDPAYLPTWRARRAARTDSDAVSFMSTEPPHLSLSRITSNAFADTVVVDLHARPPEGSPLAEYTEEWTFGRLRAVGAGQVTAQRCPVCSAPLELADDGRSCRFCGTSLAAGWNWRLMSIVNRTPTGPYLGL